MAEPSAIPWFFHDSNTHLDDPKAPLPVPTATAAAATSQQRQKPTGHDKDKKLDDSRTDPMLKVSSGLSPAKTPPQSPSSSSPATPSPSPGPETSSTKDKPKFTNAAGYLGSPAPNTNWYAFNPNDNAALEKEYQTNNLSDKKIPVGLNRLFYVNLNKAKLDPIYWPPVGRTPHVHRATWFFSSTLTPIDPELEAGIAQAFTQIKPYSATYISELKSALSAPEALAKFKVPITYHDGKSEVTYEVVFAPCPIGSEKVNVIEEYAKDSEMDREKNSENDADKDSDASRSLKEPFGDEARPEESEHKEDKDTENKDNENVDAEGPQKWPHHDYPVAYLSYPSTSPLSYIMPGSSKLISSVLEGKTPSSTVFTIQRHFSWDSWKKLKNLPDRPTDDKDFSPKKTYQLVLVLHGIGQKLSERVESFNFTYAINNFRISVNEKLKEPGVVPFIDPDCVGDGILVLPVNWRRALDFDQLGNPSSSGNDETSERYSLKDITQSSIPVVRNLVNDVLLDIPYYMSKHRPLLVSAAIKEANRVYTTFLQHNPYFIEAGGSVNIVAHSLGSLLSLDILSNQPSSVSQAKTTKEFDSEAHFKFDTRNLFLVGSPVAFFLLMENAKLYPRELLDRKHKGSNYVQYGSLAAKNIYNVLHYSDPIAYLLNPTVDPYLAREKLEQGILPNEKAFPDPNVDKSKGLIDTIASKLPSMPSMPTMPAMPAMPSMPGFSGYRSAEDAGKEVAEVGAMDSSSVTSTTGTATVSEDTVAVSNDLPMVMELEEHDFMHEKKAKDKMELLNDNGQIDWVIPLTGTLENQYLSMIMAHMSYWDNKDFARMVAVECGRKKGPEHSLEQYKAKYKSKSKVL